MNMYLIYISNSLEIRLRPWVSSMKPRGLSLNSMELNIYIERDIDIENLWRK